MCTNVSWLIIVLFYFSRLHLPWFSATKGWPKACIQNLWITIFSCELCPAACLQTRFSSLLFWFFENKRLFKAAVKLTIVIFSRVTLDVIERDDERRWEVNPYLCENPYDVRHSKKTFNIKSLGLILWQQHSGARIVMKRIHNEQIDAAAIDAPKISGIFSYGFCYF